MILYISSNFYNEYIIDAITEANQNILNQIVSEKFSLNMYLRQQLEQLQAVSTIIIDISALSDTEEEICQALNNLRLLYNNIKIIVITPNRIAGDPLLSEIFCLGIYDIISTSEEESYLLKNELIKSLNQGKTYKDSVIFKESIITKTDAKQQKQIKEKIIIRNEIKQSVNKALIGFMGTQYRVGVTHNAIVSANYLKSKGYKVAIVENDDNPMKNFHIIKNSFDNVENDKEEYFTINQVDYYQNYNFKEIHKILSKNYNFVILDFGTFRNSYLAEFSRCVVQIIVTGSKAWEIEYINRIFEENSEEILKNYTYLFNFTDLENAKIIRENMGVLEKVYFSSYTPDPFNSNYYSDLDKIFKDYLNTTTENEVKEPIYKQILLLIQELTYKIKELLKKNDKD